MLLSEFMNHILIPKADVDSMPVFYAATIFTSRLVSLNATDLTMLPNLTVQSKNISYVNDVVTGSLFHLHVEYCQGILLRVWSTVFES